jgi:tetratricopeptide (TPR) repeat protein
MVLRQEQQKPPANHDPETQGSEGRPQAASRPNVAAFFSQPGDEPPQPFVPLHPSTIDDRRLIEMLRLYSSARALEDRGTYSDAVSLLQEAEKLDPESVSIARRLSRIYIGALGKPDLAVEYAKKVLAVDPNDTDTLSRVVEFYNRKKDPASSEALLQQVLANPKLELNSTGRLVAQFELGKLYAGPLNQMEKAASAFAEVVNGLDERTSNRLTPLEQVRILTNEPASAYLGFAKVFMAAGKWDLAVKSLERGLVYDEENAEIPLVLAELLLKLNRGQEALSLVERYIKRQPQSLEAYELMAKVLKALNREGEITPRLEEAARRDSKNVPLQYVLADRYRETGQIEKADALYKSLLSTEPTPQTYRALAASLLKRRKAADLLRVISEAISRPNGLEAVSPQLQTIAGDDALAEAILDAGIQQIEAKSPNFPTKEALFVLGFIAKPERGKDRAGRLQRLVKLQRILLQQDPNPMIYRELADTLSRLEDYHQAASTLQDMMQKYPAEKNGRYLYVLADLHRRSGQIEKALEAAQEAVQLEPNESQIQALLAELLGDTGKVDQALDILRKASQKEPENPRYSFMLGGMLAKFGRNDEAIKVFQELLNRFEGNDEIAKLAHSNLSIVYVNQGDYPKGEAELEVLYEKIPDDPGINNDLGYLYAEQGKNLEKAESMIRKAVQEDSERPAYLDSLGWVLFKRGKVKEALEPLQKAVELQKAEEKKGEAPPDATIREHLGDVYLRLQEFDKARNIWEEAEKIAVKAIPPDKRLPEIRKKLASLKALGPVPKSATTRTP